MIVLAAPTGDIGHQVLENLLDGGEPIRVIARDPSAIPPSIRDRIEVVQGSHSDTDGVERAFAGAHSVFWLAPADPKPISRRSATPSVRLSGAPASDTPRESLISRAAWFAPGTQIGRPIFKKMHTETSALGQNPSVKLS